MFGWGFGYGFMSILGGMFYVMIWMLCFIVAAGILFLFVRFLLAGTHAAQLYIDKNESPRPVTPADPAILAAQPASTTASAVEKPAAVKSTATAQPAPATKPAVKSTPSAKAPAKPTASVPRTPKVSSTKAAPKKPSAS